MASETTRWSELTQFVADHILGNVNRNKLVTVMNCNSMTYKVRRYH